MGFSWQERWSGLPFPLSGDSQPWDQTQVSCISCNGRQILYQWATWEPLESESPGQILALPLLDLYKDNNAHREGLCEDKGQDGWTAAIRMVCSQWAQCVFCSLLHFFILLLIHLPWKWKLVTQLCLTLCDPMDCSPPASYVHGISQVRILEWVAISFSRGFSRPRNLTESPPLAGRFFTTEPQRKPQSIISYTV